LRAVGAAQNISPSRWHQVRPGRAEIASPDCECPGIILPENALANDGNTKPPVFSARRSSTEFQGRYDCGAKDGAFAIVGVGQHRRRRIAMRYDHDVIVVSRLPWLSLATTPCGVRWIEVAAQPTAKLIPERGRRFLGVALATAVHRAPDRAIVSQQAMVVEGDEVSTR
jgi:hypothetical protein